MNGGLADFMAAGVSCAVAIGVDCLTLRAFLLGGTMTTKTTKHHSGPMKGQLQPDGTYIAVGMDEPDVAYWLKPKTETTLGMIIESLASSVHPRPYSFEAVGIQEAWERQHHEIELHLSRFADEIKRSMEVL